MINTIVGNYENKYSEKENIIAKYFVRNYLKTFKRLLLYVGKGNIEKIADLGSGEGYLTKIIVKIYKNSQVFVSDISSSYFKSMKKDISSKKIFYSKQNVEKLKYKNIFFDLVICCEVLEHVKNPSAAIKELLRVSKDYILISVPIEPLWRFMNIMRLKYLKNFGNTPGHINHWTPFSLIRQLNSKNFDIIKINFSLPWVFVILKRKEK